MFRTRLGRLALWEYAPKCVGMSFCHSTVCIYIDTREQAWSLNGRRTWHQVNRPPYHPPYPLLRLMNETGNDPSIDPTNYIRYSGKGNDNGSLQSNLDKWCPTWSMFYLAATRTYTLCLPCNNDMPSNQLTRSGSVVSSPGC